MTDFKPRNGFQFEGDYAVVILRPRPEDVAEKLRVAKSDITREKWNEYCNKMPHQFIGYLAADYVTILSSDGERVGETIPGDTITSGPQFQPPAAAQMVIVQ